MRIASGRRNQQAMTSGLKTVGYTDTTVHLHEELYAVRDGRVEAVWPVLGRGKLR